LSRGETQSTLTATVLRFIRFLGIMTLSNIDLHMIIWLLMQLRKNHATGFSIALLKSLLNKTVYKHQHSRKLLKMDIINVRNMLST